MKIASVAYEILVWKILGRAGYHHVSLNVMKYNKDIKINLRNLGVLVNEIYCHLQELMLLIKSINLYLRLNIKMKEI